MDIYLHVAGIGYENETLVTDHDVATAQTNVVGFTRMIDTAFRYFREHGGPRAHRSRDIRGRQHQRNRTARILFFIQKYQQAYLTDSDQLAGMQNLDISFTDIRPGWIRTRCLT